MKATKKKEKPKEAKLAPKPADGDGLRRAGAKRIVDEESSEGDDALIYDYHQFWNSDPTLLVKEMLKEGGGPSKAKIAAYRKEAKKELTEKLSGNNDHERIGVARTVTRAVRTYEEEQIRKDVEARRQ